MVKILGNNFDIKVSGFSRSKKRKVPIGDTSVLERAQETLKYQEKEFEEKRKQDPSELLQPNVMHIWYLVWYVVSIGILLAIWFVIFRYLKPWEDAEEVALVGKIFNWG